MSRKRMVPPVTLKGAPVPIERTAGYAPHRVGGDGVRTDTPAAEEARTLLGRRGAIRLR